MAIKRNFLFGKKIINLNEIQKTITYTLMLLEEKIKDIEEYVTNISNKT